ncbi:MAG: CBS domain-containing protein [Chitinophagales bacterium]
MIAKKLINNTIPPLKLSDDGVKALAWIAEFHVHHLPVVDGQQYLGIISEYNIYDANETSKSLSAYDFSENPPKVHEYDHIYEVMKIMKTHRLTVMPVLDEEEQYVGLITLDTITDYLSQAQGMQDPGGIVILEMNTNDYVLSEIARLVESHDAKILSMYVTTHPNSPAIDVTLKVNKTDLTRILPTFERFDYVVKAYYQEEDYLEDVQEKYDEFMNYLNI